MARPHDADCTIRSRIGLLQSEKTDFELVTPLTRPLHTIVATSADNQAHGSFYNLGLAQKKKFPFPLITSSPLPPYPFRSPFLFLKSRPSSPLNSARRFRGAL